jgi:hypothetical protein
LSEGGSPVAEARNENETMSEQNQNQKNRSRKGGNRNRGNRNRNSGNGGGNKPSPKRDELQPGRRRRPRQQPLTLWQKFLKALGLYKDPNEADSGKGKPARKPARKSGRVPGGGRVEGKGGDKKSKSDGGKPRDKEETPTVVETPRLYVGNLSYDATEYDLEELFKGIGSVRSVELVYNRHTHKSKGYGFVSMANVDEAMRAVEVLHDQPFMGRKMIVNGARSKGPAKGGGSKGNERSRDNGNNGGARNNKKSSNRKPESETPIPAEEEVHSLAPDKD